MSWLEARGKNGILQYCREGSVRRSTGTSDRKIAEQIQNKWDKKLLISDNGLTDYDKTWREYRKDYEETFTEEAEASSLVRLRVVLNHFERINKVTESTRLLGIKEEDVRRYRAVRLKEGVLPQTVDTEQKYISPFIKSAHRNGYIEKDPFANIGRLDFYVPEAKNLSYHEAESVISDIRKHEERHALVPMFLYDTGMRMLEASHQRMEDLDFGNGFIKLKTHARDICECFQCSLDGKTGWKPKNKRERVVPMTPRLHAELLRLYQTRRSGNIFEMRGRTMWDACRRSYERLGEKTPIFKEVGGLHLFRHTIGNELRMAGVDEDIRKAWLGHSKKGAHATYQHVKDFELLDARDKLLVWREEQRTKIKKVVPKFEIIMPQEQTA